MSIKHYENGKCHHGLMEYRNLCIQSLCPYSCSEGHEISTFNRKKSLNYLQIIVVRIMMQYKICIVFLWGCHYQTPISSGKALHCHWKRLARKLLQIGIHRTPGQRNRCCKYYYECKQGDRYGCSMPWKYYIRVYFSMFCYGNNIGYYQSLHVIHILTFFRASLHKAGERLAISRAASKPRDSSINLFNRS